MYETAESPDDWLNRAPFLLLLRLEVLECHGQGRKGAVLTTASASMIVLQYITTLMTSGKDTGFHPRSPRQNAFNINLSLPHTIHHTFQNLIILATRSIPKARE